MRRTVWAMALMAVSAVTPVRAFDATGADIIGLHLGMMEADLVAGLQRQGFQVVHDKFGLTATTRDGQIVIDLTGGLGARQIRYVFTSHGAAEQERIRDSVIDRFGFPDQARPMAWCRAVGQDGHCPEDGASLTFQPETLTLLLRGPRP